MKKMTSFLALVSTFLLITVYPAIGYTHTTKQVVKEDSKEYVKSSTITADIKARLLADTEVSSLHISVKTVNGVVTLTGHVESNEQKTKAVSIAHEVDGVKSVVNKLVVTPKKK